MKIKSTNPGKNYEFLGEVEISSDQEIHEKVLSANQVKHIWKECGMKR